MPTSRRLRLTIEWEDEGLPDYDEHQPQGYLAFMYGLTSLGAEVIDEVEVVTEPQPEGRPTR